MLSKTGQARLKKRMAQRISLENQVIHLLDHLFSKVKNPSQQQFDELWNVIKCSLIDLANGKERDYRLVFQFACKQISQTIKTRHWTIFFATNLIQLKKEPVLRNNQWLGRAFPLLEIHRRWLDDIRKKGLPTSPQEAFCAYLLSLVCHSGVCQTEYLWALARRHQQNSEVRLFNGLPYLNFILAKESKHHTNDHNEQGENIYTGRVFLSPITLRLLNYFLQIKPSDFKYPNNIARLLKVLDNYLHAYQMGIKVNQSLLQSAIFVSENTGAQLQQTLVHYAIGKLNSASLPELYYKPVKLNKVQPLPLSAFIKPNIPVHSKEYSKKTSTQSDFFKALRNVMRQDPYKKTPPSTLKAQLNSIRNQAQSFPELWLLEWFISLLDKNRSSSIRTYHSRVSRRWLTMTADENLLSYSSEDFEALYLSIDSSVDKGNDYSMNRFLQLHRFGEKHYKLPPVSTQISQDTRTGKHVRSSFVSEPLFKNLLLCIDGLSQCNDTTKKIIKGILIVCYRCGLRISEATKIQRKDIMTGQETEWIYIRSNQFADNKTYHSNRKVPLSAMLLHEEKEILRDLVKAKNTHDALIFSLPNENHTPFDKRLIASVAEYFLRNLSGDNRLVLHHLRHSCMSRLQLMTVGETQDTLPNFIAYDKTQCQHILSIIINTPEQMEYALAKFAGHGDPEITYKHYYHFTDYALGKVVANSTLLIDKTLANQLFGIGRRRFAKFANDSNREFIQAADTFPLVIKQCPIVVDNKSSTTEANIEFDLIEPTTKERTFALNVTHELLSKYADGENIHALITLHDAENAFADWLTAAKEIKARYLTPQHNSRLFSVKRKHQLVPAALVSKQDRAYCEKVIIKLREQYAAMNENQRINFLKTVDYVLANCSVSKSGIRFTNPKQLKQTICTLQVLIPKSHWQANLSRITGSTKEKQWRQALKNIYCEEAQIASAKGRSGKGEVRLKLVLPVKKGRDGAIKQQTSSNLLIYLFHMMAISMWPAVKSAIIQ